jgi:hypothetical protein
MRASLGGADRCRLARTNIRHCASSALASITGAFAAAANINIPIMVGSPSSRPSW